jgi:hypothetical protein
MASGTPARGTSRENGSTPETEVREESSAKPDTPKKNGLMSKLKGFWSGLALDAPTLITMAKWMNLRQETLLWLMIA